ncbi:UNVERIFIED_CONTAM: hypothetical protein RMT77_018823 [Armadillidium vulgare]
MPKTPEKLSKLLDWFQNLVKKFRIIKPKDQNLENLIQVFDEFTQSLTGIGQKLENPSSRKERFEKMEEQFQEMKMTESQGKKPQCLEESQNLEEKLQNTKEKLQNLIEKFDSILKFNDEMIQNNEEIHRKLLDDLQRQEENKPLEIKPETMNEWVQDFELKFLSLNDKLRDYEDIEIEITKNMDEILQVMEDDLKENPQDP